MGGETRRRLGFEVVEDSDGRLAIVSGERIGSDFPNVRVFFKPLLDPLLEVFTPKCFYLHSVQHMDHASPFHVDGGKKEPLK